jgi:hypothetical protein
MRTNFASKFIQVADQRPVPDPWGFGVTFIVGRMGREPYAAWLRDQMLANPVYVAQTEAMAKAGFRAAVEGVDVETIAKDLLRQAAEGAASPTAREILELNSAEREIDGMANHLLLGWSGMTDAETGAPEPYSVEAAKELLRSTDWVAAGLPYSGGTIEVADAKDAEKKVMVLDETGKTPGPGQQLGLSLRQFLRYEAGRGEAYRSNYVETAARNLEPSSAGPAASG